MSSAVCLLKFEQKFKIGMVVRQTVFFFFVFSPPQIIFTLFAKQIIGGNFFTNQLSLVTIKNEAE